MDRIQIKSASVETIIFEREQVSWLFDLELPFFVASVNRSEAAVSLFCCHRLSDAFVTNATRERLVIHLAEEPTAEADEFVGTDVVDVYVGPPILTWSIQHR